MRKLAGGRKRRRGCFKQSECALHLPGLVLQPFRLMLVGSAPAALVDRQNGRVENAVAQGLQPQRRKTRRGCTRNDLTATGAIIEILKDHTRVVIRRPV